MKWKDFKEEVSQILNQNPKFRIHDSEGKATPLFRGQANSEWDLTTTLERHGREKMDLHSYIQDCSSTKRILGNLFDGGPPFNEEFDCSYSKATMRFPNYEYCAYLRHHGFPSPLLDWTESPFVAAFFAFRSIQPEVKEVSIYSYRDYLERGRGWESAQPNIFTSGPFAPIHERHLTQQCWYTYCLAEHEGMAEIRPHEEFFSIQSSRTHPDDSCELKEWKIDASERSVVLGDLIKMNITPFSLFRNIEGAAETAALKIIGV